MEADKAKINASIENLKHKAKAANDPLKKKMADSKSQFDAKVNAINILPKGRMLFDFRKRLFQYR